MSRNSLVSFSICPSYKLVVMFIRPIFDSPKSVSLMCPKEVINKLQNDGNINISANANFKTYSRSQTWCKKRITKIRRSKNSESLKCCVLPQSRGEKRKCVKGGLTCQVSGLCARCRSCGDTPKPGRSLQNTSEPCPQAEDQCSSIDWHNLPLNVEK